MSDTLPLSIINNRRMEKWVRFLPDRTVKLAVGKVEIGQAVLIALTQIAAEELDIAIDRFTIVSGDTADAPDEGSTSSSQSIEVSGRSVRLITAELRARVPGLVKLVSAAEIEAAVRLLAEHRIGELQNHLSKLLVGQGLRKFLENTLIPLNEAVHALHDVPEELRRGL